MNPPPDLLKIGDFARRAETNLRTLRYYEELGLLQPALRSDGGFRYYRPTDLNRVRMIHNLQELGLQLDSIRDLLDTRHPGDEDGTEARRAWLGKLAQALREQERLIDDRIGSLSKQKDHVAAALAKLRECDPCPHCPAAENNFCEPCQNTGHTLPEFLSALF